MRGSCREATDGANAASFQLAPSGPEFILGRALRATRGGHLPRIAGEELVAHTRLWLGTPYRHQASTLGAGCDCLGLVRGVWRALRGAEPEPPPPYRPDWAETGGRELLLEAFARWLIPIDTPEPGDVLVFRMAPGAVAKHCAIQSGPGRMIHAYWGRACVESVLGRWWRERLAAAFRFPAN